MMFSSCNAQQKKVNATVVDGNLVGIADRTMLQQAPFNSWYDLFHKDYQVDETVISQLKPHMKGVKIKLFMGTWCGDSKHEVPRIIKILLAAGMDTSNLSIIAVGNGVDMYKKSPQGEEIGLNIRRVPSLIVYEKKKEIGRFIEYPVVSIEKDLLRILLKDGYVPNYANLKD